MLYIAWAPTVPCTALTSVFLAPRRSSPDQRTATQGLHRDSSPLFFPYPYCLHPGRNKLQCFAEFSCTPIFSCHGLKKSKNSLVVILPFSEEKPLLVCDMKGQSRNCCPLICCYTGLTLESLHLLHSSTPHRSLQDHFPLTAVTLIILKGSMGDEKAPLCTEKGTLPDPALLTVEHAMGRGPEVAQVQGQGYLSGLVISESVSCSSVKLEKKA